MAVNAAAITHAGSSRPLISVGAVGKVYRNGTEALREVSLSIPQSSQFISILGPSGCGKSTLLRLIAGLERPTAGQIEWPTSDHDVHGQPLEEIGFVFQEPTLMPWATVFENMYLPLRIKGQNRHDARQTVLDALRLVRLEPYAKCYPAELSGGMKMRVSVARALVKRPRVLLMDEPFAALDEVTRQQISDDLLEIWRTQRCTVIFVTHSIYESVYLSNRIVVMANGSGSVIADLPIDAPYPRSEIYRTSPRYGEHCRVVSQWLKRAIGTGGSRL
jgi:NitT/TauT family transport system ATP-binding protein